VCPHVAGEYDRVSVVNIRQRLHRIANRPRIPT
jgi:hypothetical protein